MDDADSACSGGVASSEDNDRRRAIAKLVDMGFAPEESRRALAEEAEDREAGGEPGANALEQSVAMTAAQLGSCASSGRRPTGRPATASGARASRLQQPPTSPTAAHFTNSRPLHQQPPTSPPT